MKPFLLVGVAIVALVPATGLLSRAHELGRRYALLVGVKNYERTGLGNLKYPEDDVHSLADVLKSAGFKLVVMTQKAARDKDNDDLSPTADNIRANLKGLLEDRQPRDTVLVFFSGHGGQLKKTNKMYFFPRKANLDDPKTLVSLTEVYDLLKRKADADRGGYKVLLVDACRNDPVDGKAAGDERLESVTRPLQEKLPGGVAALFSCSQGQKSFESDVYKHGFFTHFLIEGLKGQAANPKTGEIDLLGLANFVKNEMPFAVKEEKGPRFKQTPHLLSDLREAPALSRVNLDKTPTVRPQPGNWTPLFNGKDLTGWKYHPDQPGEWQVRDGVLTSGGPRSHLFSERGDFANFHLRARAKVNAQGNSGIYFRSEFGLNLPVGGRTGSFPAAYEAQIFCGGTGDQQRTGSLYDFVPVAERLVEPDTWFTLEVIAQGRHLVIKVDGKTTVDFVDKKNTYAKGHFALQQLDRNTVAQFRTIEVKKLPPADEAADR